MKGINLEGQIRSQISRAMQLLGAVRQLGKESTSEIYSALERLGADGQLLATIGSWGDTLDDNECSNSSRNGMRKRSSSCDRKNSTPLVGV
jgi:hypothetical protein